MADASSSSGVMQGRWTIHPNPETWSNVHSARGPRADGPVPVVPCDDAAIERAAAALSNRGVLTHREYVEIAFRAAAEVPR